MRIGHRTDLRVVEFLQKFRGYNPEGLTLCPIGRSGNIDPELDGPADLVTDLVKTVDFGVGKSDRKLFVNRHTRLTDGTDPGGVCEVFGFSGRSFVEADDRETGGTLSSKELRSSSCAGRGAITCGLFSEKPLTRFAGIFVSLPSFQTKSAGANLPDCASFNRSEDDTGP